MPKDQLLDPIADDNYDAKAAGYNNQKFQENSDANYTNKGTTKTGVQDKVAKEIERKRRSILIYGCEDMRSVIV